MRSWTVWASISAALLIAAAPRAAGAQDRFAALLRSWADPLVKLQGPDGGHQLPPRVQAHLKADMALAVAARVTRDGVYLRSAARDLDWVRSQRLEWDGGLNWDGPDNPWFFDVHQNWFLIASELIRRQLPSDPGLQIDQHRAWWYLRAASPAQVDWYQHDFERNGAFFAYRDVDRQGVFQRQAPFKGSYEVGAALWALALHQSSPWVDEPELMERYLDALAGQAVEAPAALGYFDQVSGRWVRALRWTGSGWSGYDPPDWKYALHMEEGALAAVLERDLPELVPPTRAALLVLLERVGRDGAIVGLPDVFGSEWYEYGEALSVLGLGSRVFRGRDPDLSARCRQAGRSVLSYVERVWHPFVSEDSAILLLGIGHMVEALAPSTPDLSLAAPRLLLPGPEVRVWPNPTGGELFLEFSGTPGAAGTARLLDAAGRSRATLPLRVGADGRGLATWQGEDASGRELPSGRYFLLFEIGEHHASRGVTLAR